MRQRLVYWGIAGIRCVLPIPRGVCRFHPSCTEYAAQALTQYPLPKAVFLIARRIVRCNPLFSGGYDPVRRGER